MAATVENAVTRATGLLIVVPARGGSKRLPGKNLRKLGGRPLIDHTADAIRAGGLGDTPCLLSTDDEAIAARGRSLGWLVPWLRPRALAGDDSPTVAAVLHALDWFSATHGGDPARVMVLQPTSPLRRPAALREALAMMDAAAATDAVVGVRRLHVPEGALFAIDGNGYLMPVRAGGDLVANGAVYLVRATALRASGTLYPPRTVPLVMDDIASIDIDSEADWRLAEAALGAGDIATR